MIRIGVIGGGLGTRCIIPKFREIENCQVEALMSGHYSNAQHLAKIYGIVKANGFSHKILIL